MKRGILAAVVAVIGIAAAGCSTLTTSADYDPSTDFSRYKSWDYHGESSINNELLAKRVESAVGDELTKKGMTRNAQNPDLLVVVHARLSKETRINTYDSGWGYGWRWGGGMSTSTVQEIPVGALVVDLVDVNKKELVWRGTASDTLDPSRTPEQKDAAIREAMSKLFSTYPPAKKAS